MYTVLLLFTIFVLLYLYSTRRHDHWKKKHVPYLPPVPFFGNLLPLLGMKQPLGPWFLNLCRNIKSPYFGFYIFDRPVLIVQSPKLIRDILIKDFSYFEDRSVETPQNDAITRNLLFLMKNPEWKAFRNKLTPAFTSGKLKFMYAAIVEETKPLIDYIGKLVNVPDVESKEICAKFTTDIVGRCIFGLDAKSFGSEDAEFRAIGKRIFDFTYSNALRQIGAFFLPTLIKIFNLGFVDDYAKFRLSSIFTDVMNIRSGTKSRQQLLSDILINIGNENNFSREALIGQAIQFYIAGFETTSGTLSFSLYELAIHPEVQDRLRDEIRQNTNDTNGIDYETLMQMKYLDMCINETLRKYPVLPFLDRVCRVDYKLPGTDLVIEKGTAVYVPMFPVHYDPEVYPEPDRYDPERFADKSKINADGLSFIPFGDGPRACIGLRFGLLVVKLGLVSILSKYKVVPSAKTPVPMKFEAKSMILQSNVGIPVEFVKV